MFTQFFFFINFVQLDISNVYFLPFEGSNSSRATLFSIKNYNFKIKFFPSIKNEELQKYSNGQV